MATKSSSRVCVGMYGLIYSLYHPWELKYKYNSDAESLDQRKESTYGRFGHNTEMVLSREFLA